MCSAPKTRDTRRRARKVAGEDPDETPVRPASQVENHLS
ncbi:DUF2630 family protein [Streptomyces sp. NBC_00316]